ncbi:MAG: hypothetical protein J6S43_03610 [Lentisphaeria bacterium]|nr:hypothetical protein [Lentisphaeria bacterium]
MKIYVSREEENLQFDADFEGGNLGRAVRLGENYYFIELRPDTTYQFRFRIRNCKGKKVVISFRCRDYKPALSHWNGGNYHYRMDGKLYSPVVTYNGIDYQDVDHFENDRSTFDDLYTIVHTFTGDCAYVSSAPVYLYSDMLKFLDSISSNPAVKISSIGFSRNEVVQPLLEISGDPAAKKAVYIISREDADEMTGSFALEGAVNELLSDTPEAAVMRKKFRFFIVPMVGVDGVIAGSYHSAGYGYGGLRFHREDYCPEELQNVKDFSRQLFSGELQVVLAGKIHGNWGFVSDLSDFMASEQELCDKVAQKRTAVWNPADEAIILTTRPEGYFERFINDNFGLQAVFGCHVNGTSAETSRVKGRDLMRALFNYLQDK